MSCMAAETHIDSDGICKCHTLILECRPLPEEVYQHQSETSKPLLSMRQDVFSPELGEDLESLPLLERLLRCENSAAHERIAAILWDR